MNDNKRIELLEAVGEWANRCAIAAPAILRVMHANEGAGARYVEARLGRDVRDPDTTDGTGFCDCGQPITLDGHEFVECDCGRVHADVSQARRDDPMVSEFNQLDADLKAALNAVERIAKRMERWQPKKGHEATGPEQQRAQGEIDKREENKCRVHARIGELVGIWDDVPEAKRLHLCRFCYELRRDLDRFEQIHMSDDLLKDAVKLIESGEYPRTLNTKLIAQLAGLRTPAEVKMPKETRTAEQVKAQLDRRGRGRWFGQADLSLGVRTIKREAS